MASGFLSIWIKGMDSAFEPEALKLQRILCIFEGLGNLLGLRGLGSVRSTADEFLLGYSFLGDRL